MAIKGIQKIEFADDADWAAATGTFVEIDPDDLLKEEFSMGEATEFLTEKANETEELDGLKFTGKILTRADAANTPADGDTGVFKVTPESGDVTYYGGVNGAKCRVYTGGARPLSAGQWFKRIVFTYAGANDAAVKKTTWA